ncbi:MAG: XrtB/PEP-CTERM-associated polysaccharide biosynthesis outer membrane protein EpsL [Steroidobacteraceae bacterium]
MTRRRAGGAALAAAVLMAARVAPAAALPDEVLELYVSQAFADDDNVFRLAPEADPLTELGVSSRGDSYWTTAFGIKVDAPVRRQRIVAELRFDRQRYERFDVLDLDGHQGQVVWHWQAGERSNGRVGYGESLAQASLANVQGGVQSSTPNVLETRQWLGDAALALTTRWRIEGGVQRLRHENSADEFSPSDATVDSVRLGPVYVTGAGNRVGASLQHIEGRLPNPQIVAGAPVDNDYRQDGAEAFVEWRVGGRSRVTARAGRVRREFQEVPQRDFDGWTWRLGLEWQPADKLLLGATAAKEVSATEQVDVGLVRVEGLTLTAAWKPRDKIDVACTLLRADREYLGDAAIALGVVPARSERFKSAGVTVSYRPRPSVTLELSLRRERRDSTDPLGDFQADLAGVAIRFAL